MTYNRANSSIAKAYNSIYARHVRRITESVNNDYSELLDKVTTLGGGKQLIDILTSDLNTDSFVDWCSEILGDEKFKKQYESEKDDHPSHSLRTVYTDKFLEKLYPRNTNSDTYTDRKASSNTLGIIKSKILPFINTDEKAENISNSFSLSKPIDPFVKTNGPVVTPTDTTTGNEPKTKEDLEAEKEEKEEGGADQSDSKTDKSDSKTDKSDNSTGDSGGSTELPKASDGKDDTTNKNKKPIEVEIPDISIEVVNAYREDLESKVNVLKNIRERIRTILQLQSEMINQFKNPQGSQQGQQGQQYTQMYDGRDWTPTTVPTYQQGHQGDAHYQQAPQTQQQKVQPQQQNTSKQDDDEGFLSKAWNGVKKAGSGVLDIASAPIGAVKDGLDAASDWLSKE